MASKKPNKTRETYRNMNLLKMTRFDLIILQHCIAVRLKQLEEEE